MTHPPTLCASCMSQGEIAGLCYGVAMLAEVGERARGSSRLTAFGWALPVGAARAASGDASGSPRHLIGAPAWGGAAGFADARCASPGTHSKRFTRPKRKFRRAYRSAAVDAKRKFVSPP